MNTAVGVTNREPTTCVSATHYSWLVLTWWAHRTALSRRNYRNCIIWADGISTTPHNRAVHLLHCSLCYKVQVITMQACSALSVQARIAAYYKINAITCNLTSPIEEGKCFHLQQTQGCKKQHTRNKLPHSWPSVSACTLSQYCNSAACSFYHHLGN